MTTNTTLTEAERLLRRDAESVRESHTSHSNRNDCLDADDLAEVAASSEEDTARLAGRGPVIWDDPEWAADEELSYWGDDDGE